MNHLPANPLHSTSIPPITPHAEHHKKRHPYRVHVDRLLFHKEGGKHEIKAVVGNKELWDAFPVINLVEIRHTNEIGELKKSLTVVLNRSKKPQITHIKEYNLKPYGIDRKIQVLGNTYVPIRKSEHPDIQAALMKLNLDQGIKNKHGLTFIIVEDALFEKVMLELQHHSNMVMSAHHETEASASQKHERELPKHRITKDKELKLPKEEIATAVNAWKKTALKELKNIFAEALHTKERSKEKRELERQKEEKCIKYGIEQFERLQQMVLKEATKKNLSMKDIEIISTKWDDSSPPFPVRAVHFSTLWREYKTKMTDDLLKAFAIKINKA